jgi:DNA-binding GntR family transcriptional regulator
MNRSVRSELPVLQRRPQLSTEVASHVRDLILSGQVRSGQFLRLERLAEDLGTSVTPVREALVALHGEGFVELEPRRGYVVGALSRQDIGDVFRVQADIAGELAARTAGLVRADQLIELRAVLAELETAVHERTDRRAEQLIDDLHLLINRLAASPKLTWFLGKAVRYSPSVLRRAIDGWLPMTLDDHRRILDALARHDPGDARHAMHDHVTRSGTLLLECLDRQGFWA